MIKELGISPYNLNLPYLVLILEQKDENWVNCILFLYLLFFLSFQKPGLGKVIPATPLQ